MIWFYMIGFIEFNSKRSPFKIQYETGIRSKGSWVSFIYLIIIIIKAAIISSSLPRSKFPFWVWILNWIDKEKKNFCLKILKILPKIFAKFFLLVFFSNYLLINLQIKYELVVFNNVYLQIMNEFNTKAIIYFLNDIVIFIKNKRLQIISINQIIQIFEYFLNEFNRILIASVINF